MDSISRVAILEYCEKAYSELNDSICKKILSGGNITRNSASNPEQQALVDEIGSVAKKFNPKNGLSKFADALGDINQKAEKTLSSTDATVVYAVSMMTYYSAKYWSTEENRKKWQKLRENAKKKAKK
jgi:hypothetical protein